VTVRVLPAIKRFFEGTASAVFAPSGDEPGRAKDFMRQDLTGSARTYSL
jgi:hypothetical protein